MKNGEGSVSSDPFDSFPQRSDGGGDGDESPASLSRYSSCGESEFERYCSANSVMGTPSMCSSSFRQANESVETEFGSFDGNFENFSLGRGGFDGNSEEDHRSLSNLDSDCLQGSVDREGIVKDDNDVGSCGEEGKRDDRGGCLDGSGFDRREMKREDEDGLSSRCEYSEDDDSMYGCGSDDENGKSLYVHRSVQNGKESAAKDENPLLINSSVAFGSEDWDDFEQEIGGGPVVSLMSDRLSELKKHDLETEPNLFSVTLSDALKASVNFPTNAAEEPECVRQVEDDKFEGSFRSCSGVHDTLQSDNKVEEVRDITVPSYQIQDASESSKDDQEDVVDISIAHNPLQGVNGKTEQFKSSFVGDVFEMGHDPLVDKISMASGLDVRNCSMEKECPCVKSEETIHSENTKVPKHQEAGNVEVVMDPLSDKSIHFASRPSRCLETSAEFPEDSKPNSVQPVIENGTNKTPENIIGLMDLSDESPKLDKAENLEHNEFYDEIVNEMEEILLDSGESSVSRFPQGNHLFHSSLSLPPRDGGSTASTSGTDIAFPLTTQPLRIDGIEVVGAKQRKGDVSLSERLVGVKEYTVYMIRVWSGNDQWQVERRYRDFYTLYRRLKSLFADQGWNLPSPWSTVEKESRKIFGNVSPDVISERSALIQECLRSVLHSGLFSTPPSALAWFLCAQDSLPSAPASKSSASWSLFSNVAAETEKISNLGKTISLIVEIRPYKSMKQMLEAQHYTCAGCHKHFDDGMTLMRDFVQTLGWGKPRLCEYTGQLFCSSCHTNETAVLPARVLHFWDFNRYPVSQLAKSFLDSIHEQPMLCVSAVNPFLFSRVPVLHHVMNVRKKIGTMLPYVRCPFRRTINKGLGSRRYLLESNDFFALRDLVDLSKGPFSALPVMVETVSKKILEHITEQCLLCCDVGEPCSARQACDDPSSLIFPFQEGEIKRCASCKSAFHKSCFSKLAHCSCGADLGVGEGNATALVSRKAASGHSSVPPKGLLSGLFSKANSGQVNDQKYRDTIILMGSLPSTTL